MRLRWEVKAKKWEERCKCHFGLNVKTSKYFSATFYRMWWTITGNFGNILPIDWSKSYARQLHTKSLKLGEKRVSLYSRPHDIKNEVNVTNISSQRYLSPELFHNLMYLLFAKQTVPIVTCTKFLNYTLITFGGKTSYTSNLIISRKMYHRLFIIN